MWYFLKIYRNTLHDKSKLWSASSLWFTQHIGIGTHYWRKSIWINLQDKIHEVLQRSPLNHQNTWSPLSMPALRPWSLRCFGSFSTRKSQTLEHLRHPAARGEVFLVGTSHISAASAAEAKHCKHKTQENFLCCFLIHSLEKSFKVSQDALLGTQKTARQNNYLHTYMHIYIYLYIVRKRQNNI